MNASYANDIVERRAEILARMDAALAVSGRTSGDATLVAVSKTVGVGEVLAAIDAGYRVFGENRPQDSIASSKDYRLFTTCPTCVSI